MLDEERIEKRHAGAVAMHHRDEDQQRRRRHQAGDQDFLEPVEDAKKHQTPASRDATQFKRAAFSIAQQRIPRPSRFADRA